jgi:very-short-patch-repair endonuclease
MQRSSGEELVAHLLKEAFPFMRVKEQYFIKYLGHKLYFDFYLPSYKLAIEIQGQQHYKFIQFFHGNKQGWQSHKKRDALKQEWALETGTIILELNKTNFPKTGPDLLTLITDRVIND